MSFTYNPPKTEATGFSFGTPSGDAKGANKTFGTPTAQTQPFGQKPATAFSLNSTPASAAPTGFGAPSTGAPAFGATPAATGFGITPAATPASSASFGFNLGGAKTTTSSSTGFTLGGTAATTTSASAGFGSSTFSLGSTPATSAPTFNLGGSSTADSGSAAKTPSLSFSTPTTAVSSGTPAGTTPSLGFAASAATAKKTTAGTTSFSFSTPTSSTAPAVSLSGGLTTTTSTALTSSVILATGTLTFAQLEDSINKWTIDLEEQGKLFANQAKQLNAWDRLLISNGDKVLALNNGIERVKQQQQQLDQELDFVLAQHKELEDLLTPLEKELEDVPVTDIDRGNTYQIAENVDTQLKQMTEDLKEIIEQLNESNKTQEMSNPITQIGKILNVHMNSLQWIDHNTTKITTHLDQISKMHDLNRKSHEINLKRTYD